MRPVKLASMSEEGKKEQPERAKTVDGLEKKWTKSAKKLLWKKNWSLSRGLRNLTYQISEVISKLKQLIL